MLVAYMSETFGITELIDTLWNVNLFLSQIIISPT